MARRSGGLLGWFYRSRKAVACALVLALAPFMVGCYGPFVLTKAVHRVNGTVPVGIVTALSGGPFFIYLLRRRSHGGVR